MPTITETTARIGTGIPGCEPCGCEAIVDCPCPVPAHDLTITYDQSGLIITCEGEVGSTACTLTGIVISVPLLYQGGSNWQSDCYTALQFAPPGTDSFFLNRIRRAGFSCTEANWIANIQSSDETSEDPDPECPDPVPSDFEQGTNPPPSIVGVGCSVDFPFQWNLISQQCDPLILLFQLECDIGGGACIYIHDGPLPPLVAEICANVHRPACDEDPGDPLSGIDVEFFDSEDVSVGTCTTDAGGECCLPITTPGRYRVVATDADGCTAETFVVVSLCGGTVAADLTLCCATGVCVLIVDWDGETETGPIEGAVVDFGSPWGEVTTDAEGKACIDLTTAQIMALPTAGDCNTRTLTVPEVRAENIGDPERTYLYRCDQPVIVECGSVDPTPTTIRLRKIPLNYQINEECCGPTDCTQVGLEDRSLLARIADCTLVLNAFASGGGTYWTRTFTGLELVLDDAELALSGEIWHDSGCVDITNIPWTCGDEGEFDWPYTHMRVRVQTCRPSDAYPLVKVRLYRGGACDDFNPVTTSNCPDCFDEFASLDIQFEADDAFSGSKTLCYDAGGFSAAGTETFAFQCRYDWDIDVTPQAPT